MNHEIISRAEAKARGLKHYFTGKPCKRGGIAKRLVVDGQCKCVACCGRRAEYQASYYPGWAAANKHSLDAYQASYRAEKSKSRVAYNAKWRAANPERHSELQAEYRARNPEKGAACAAMRRARIAMATPSWLTEQQRAEIEALYLERERVTGATGIVHHVDHIIPLRGNNVCGLHVPWNLRVIPANDNLKKGNRLAS